MDDAVVNGMRYGCCWAAYYKKISVKASHILSTFLLLELNFSLLMRKYLILFFPFNF